MPAETQKRGSGTPQFGIGSDIGYMHFVDTTSDKPGANQEHKGMNWPEYCLRWLKVFLMSAAGLKYPPAYL